jgi:hypothetical protein
MALSDRICARPFRQYVGAYKQTFLPIVDRAQKRCTRSSENRAI